MLMFFIDEDGHGYFEDLKQISLSDLEKDWSGASRRKNTFCFWGQYAYERVERTREKYFIEIKMKKKNLEAYKISGPRITAPQWRTVEEREKINE